MTPTPDDEAGRLTEKVMSRFKEYAILLPYEAAYNRMYEHVYRVLSAHLEPAVPLMTGGRALHPAVLRALEFYADFDAYRDHSKFSLTELCTFTKPPVLVDRGGLARSALRAVGK